MLQDLHGPCQMMTHELVKPSYFSLTTSRGVMGRKVGRKFKSRDLGIPMADSC